MIQRSQCNQPKLKVKGSAAQRWRPGQPRQRPGMWSGSKPLGSWMVRALLQREQTAVCSRKKETSGKTIQPVFSFKHDQRFCYQIKNKHRKKKPYHIIANHSNIFCLIWNITGIQWPYDTLLSCPGCSPTFTSRQLDEAPASSRRRRLENEFIN